MQVASLSTLLLASKVCLFSLLFFLTLTICHQGFRNLFKSLSKLPKFDVEDLWHQYQALVRVRRCKFGCIDICASSVFSANPNYQFSPISQFSMSPIPPSYPFPQSSQFAMSPISPNNPLSSMSQFSIHVRVDSKKKSIYVSNIPYLAIFNLHFPKSNILLKTLYPNQSILPKSLHLHSACPFLEINTPHQGLNEPIGCS